MGRTISKALILLTLAFTVKAGDEAAQLYRDGLKAEGAGDTLHAYLLFARAAMLDPANPQYLARKISLGAMTQMLTRGEADSAQDDPGQPLDPALAAVLATQDLSPGEIAEARDALPPVRLKPSIDKKSFDLRGGAQTVIAQVANAFGIEVVFENNYQPPPQMMFRTGELDMEAAFHTLEAAAGSLIIPVNEKLALVVRDSPQRRADTTPAMSVAIPIPERISAQDAQEIVTAVQQTLDLRHISVDPGRRVVYVRDAVSRAIAARALFGELSRLRAQVAIDVEVLSVAKTSTLGIGLNLPNASAIVNFGDFLHNAPATLGFTKFLTFGGGASLFGLGVTDAQLFATIARSSAKTVLESRVVTLDGQPGSLHVGDRYPIVTNQYVGSTNGPGQVYAPPPTVNFEDLGLVLKITPSIHAGGEVSLDVDAAFKVLGTGGANGIPSISQRRYQGKVRLASNEWAVIAGLAAETRANTTTGIAGLAEIPALGRLFRRDTIDKNNVQVLIVLKPRLLNLPPWEFETQTLWVGTQSRPLTVF